MVKVQEESPLKMFFNNKIQGLIEQLCHSDSN